MRKEIQSRSYPNVTTKTGKLVHRSEGGYAACRYLRGIMYTDELVNCPKCTSTSGTKASAATAE